VVSEWSRNTRGQAAHGHVAPWCRASPANATAGAAKCTTAVVTMESGAWALRRQCRWQPLLPRILPLILLLILLRRRRRRVLILRGIIPSQFHPRSLPGIIPRQFHPRFLPGILPLCLQRFLRPCLPLNLLRPLLFTRTTRQATLGLAAGLGVAVAGSLRRRQPGDHSPPHCLQHSRPPQPQSQLQQKRPLPLPSTTLTSTTTTLSQDTIGLAGPGSAGEVSPARRSPAVAGHLQLLLL